MLSLTDGSQLLVYGTVLPWLGSAWHRHPAANGQAFQAALTAQLADWHELAERYPSAPMLVAGDLNQDLVEHHYYGSKANREAVRQALSSAGLHCLTAGTADPVARLTGGTRASVDHICIGPGLRQIDPDGPVAWPPQTAPDSKLSDHFGSVVNVAPG